jgi:hypothetical protein
LSRISGSLLEPSGPAQPCAGIALKKNELRHHYKDSSIDAFKEIVDIDTEF